MLDALSRDSDPLRCHRPARRILFVDDEPKVLASLERMLSARHQEWEMAFVGDGREALALLETERFDVLVSDMRMPGVDGMQLLRRVRADYPHMVRLVLSGYSEFEQALCAVPLAHQFLAKPCDADLLKAAVDRAWHLEHVLGDERIREVIGGIDALPPLPRLCAELNRLIADPDVSLLSVARLVEQDPAMTANILHLVNSSFFTLSRRLTSIRAAVSALGLNLLRNLVVSLSMLSVFQRPERSHSFSYDRLQAHSLAVARLAQRICPTPEHADDAFITGLLSDVGQLVLATRAPSLMSTLIEEARQTGVSLHQVELARLGVSHAEIGAALLARWELPYQIVEGVAYHHDASRIVVPHRCSAADCAYLAHVLVHQAEGAPHDPFEVSAPPLDDGYLDMIGVAGDLHRWRDLAAGLLATAA